MYIYSILKLLGFIWVQSCWQLEPEISLSMALDKFILNQQQEVKLMKLSDQLLLSLEFRFSNIILWIGKQQVKMNCKLFYCSGRQQALYSSAL